LEHLAITADNRELRHEDGQPITDYDKTLEESNIQDGENLKY
jgi:hypothetical protein